MHLIQGYEYIAFEWAMIAVTFIIVLVRLYVRVYLHGYIGDLKSWRWSEFFVILGWLLFLGVAISDSIAVDVGGRNVNPNYKMTDKENIVFMKVMWTWSFLYKPSIYCMKAALLAFYIELIDRSEHRKIWIAILITAVLNALGACSQIFYILFQCIPIHTQWSLEHLSCTTTIAYPITTWSFHVFTDLLVFALPFAILRSALSLKQMSGALIMFGLGIINVASAIVLFVLRVQPQNRTDIPITALAKATTLLYTVQIATAIAIPCCPQIRLFYKHVTERSTPATIDSHGTESDTVRSSVEEIGDGWLRYFRRASVSKWPKEGLSPTSSDQPSKEKQIEIHVYADRNDSVV